MRINKFKKIGSNKYKIYFDNETLMLYEDIILKYNLLFKKEVDSDLLIQINKDNYQASIYDLALKYINVRMRSKKEVYNYLISKNYDEKDINNTINILMNQNIINDKLFCKSYVNDKLNLTNSGLDKIRMELINFGINESIIDDVFKTIDKKIINDKLLKIIQKDIKINSNLPLMRLRSKIINRCVYLGYNYEDINNILDNINISSKSDIKSEYEKLLKKYSSKYTGYKLESFIKSKLYQKGYSVEEINNIFDN